MEENREENAEGRREKKRKEGWIILFCRKRCKAGRPTFSGRLFDYSFWSPLTPFDILTIS
jgi:hypothetical protein